MSTRRGIPIRNPRDRGAEILADPDGYFRQARENARRIVEADAARERRRITAHHPDDDPPPPDPGFAVEVAALLVLAAVGFIVAAFAVQACV